MSDRARTAKSIALVAAAPFSSVAVIWLCVQGASEARVPAQRLPTPSSATSVWDARTRAWTSARPLATGRTGGTASLRSDGLVLLAGGSVRTRGSFGIYPARGPEVWWPTGLPVLTEAVLADARAGTLPTLPGPAPPRHVEATAVVALRDGRTLLVGGADGDPPEIDARNTYLQVWTPSTERWQPAATWPGRASRHVAAQLSGGDVLVLRGLTGSWRGEDEEAALWNPSTGELTPIAPPTASVVQGSTLTAVGDGLALHVGAPAPEVWSTRGERVGDRGQTRLTFDRSRRRSAR